MQQKSDAQITDLDVHMALVMAPSYQKKVREQYYMEESALKEARDYVDTFGFAQKNMNAVCFIVPSKLHASSFAPVTRLTHECLLP